jgi:hypothetical protein
MDNTTPPNTTPASNAGIPSGGFIPTNSVPASPIPTPPQPQVTVQPAAPISQPVQPAAPTQAAPDVNPLRQYFRRPAVHIRLPSNGIGYSSGVLDIPSTGELPVYPMTAIDEITARTPDALFNGSAVAELIRSCIPSIKDPWSITNIDLDAILIGIKAASSSGEMDIDTVCPECNEESRFGVSLMGLLSSLTTPDYTIPLTVNELSIKFRPLTYKEINDVSIKQFEIQREFAAIAAIVDQKERDEKSHAALEKITFLSLDLLANTVEYIQTPAANVTDKKFILDFLKNCDRNVFIKLRDYNASLKESGEIKPLQITCQECSHEYTQPFTLNPADFFE